MAKVSKSLKSLSIYHFSIHLDDREKVPLPPAPIVSEFDPMKLETNEEFISRLKHMGKSNEKKKKGKSVDFISFRTICVDSMDKFNQLARKFTIKKPTKSSRQPM